MNAQLRQVVVDLLASGRVKTVIGYREHPLSGAVVPALLTRPEEAEGLIFDERCVFNLARCPRRGMAEPIGVVVKGCDGRALNMRITEGDFAREAIVAIAVQCPGVTDADGGPAARCQRCTMRLSPIADVQVGDAAALPPPVRTRRQDIETLRAMSPPERLAFWREAFDRCVRCYACRDACPLCNCDVCITDQNAPQWIEQTPKPSSNMMWHLVRALHHAGRCVDCGECERACPEQIPMHLLDLCLAEDVHEMFDFETGQRAGEKWPLLSYDTADPESWLKGPDRG